MTWQYWADAADKNKDPISAAIAPYLKSASTVLEIGSGTGQHAVHLSRLNPHLQWQCSEHPSGFSALKANHALHAAENMPPPIALDAAAEHWPKLQADVSFSANTLHIMPWDACSQLFKHLGNALEMDGHALFYGPFRFGDRPFAPSNARFDSHLRQRDARSGIRNIDSLREQASINGLYWVDDIELPANNHVIVWRRGEK